MPRRDLYHGVVVEALEREGWTITDDPLHVSIGGTDLYVDLAAEMLLGAEKGGVRIAVEIKSFLGLSAVNDLQMAIGQYNVYRDVLSEVEPDRSLYLAIPKRTQRGVFGSELGRIVVEKQRLLLVVFEEQQGDLSWLPKPVSVSGTPFAR